MYGVAILLHASTLCRALRTIENRMLTENGRMEELETNYRLARQEANEADARYDEVCTVYSWCQSIL